MASTYWIKLYHEMLHDPKVMRLPDHLFRRWIELLLSAGETNEEGGLPPVADMAWVLRTTPEDMLMDLSGLERAGLIEQSDGRWIVSRFADRQAPVPDAERTRQHRDRRRRAEYYGNARAKPDPEHARHADVTKRCTDTDTDTESEQNRSEVKSVSPSLAVDEGQTAPHNTDDLSSELFRAVENAGIILNTGLADQYKDLLADIRGHPRPRELITAMFTEAKRVNARPLPPWLRRVTDRCLQQGCMPGEWSDNGNRARASPSAKTQASTPKSFRNPITGKVETL